MNQSRHCRWCDLQWPNHDDYEDCPQCAEPTEGTYRAQSMTTDDARMRRLECQFGWYLLAEWLS